MSDDSKDTAEDTGAAPKPAVRATYTPTEAELTARRKRNIALGLGLALFMIFVFFTMLARVGAI